MHPFSPSHKSQHSGINHPSQFSQFNSPTCSSNSPRTSHLSHNNSSDSASPIRSFNSPSLNLHLDRNLIPPVPSIETVKIIKHQVIHARPKPIPSSLPAAFDPPHHDGLELRIWLSIAIPYDALPPPAHPALALPLMPDHSLRLKRATVFPLTRRSPNSRPALQASTNRAEATRTASILNLAKSFRNSADSLYQPPQASVSIRNFALSLIVSPPSNPPIGLDLGPPLAEYAVVLDCLSLWSTVGPEWPFSVVLPTPPCLRNSFRLLLPPDTTQALIPSKPGDPSTLHVNTFPTLRQENLHSITPSKSSSLGGQRLPVLSDDDIPSISDESEPESASSEEGEEHSNSRLDWTQDESLPSFEGVFQSTKQLCIILGSDPDRAGPLIDSSITAKRASSSLSVAVHRQIGAHATSEPESVLLNVNFHLELDQVSTHCISNKIPFVLTIPDAIANDIISVQWSPLIGDGVIESDLPSLVKSGSETLSRSSSMATSDLSPTTPQSSNRSSCSSPSLNVSSDNLELLNTVAPFSDTKWGQEVASSIQLQDGIASAMALGSPPTSSSGSKASARSFQLQPANEHAASSLNQFVAWIDGEWLIRTVATSAAPDKFRLVFNLRCQLEMAVRPRPGPPDGATTHKYSFLMPIFMLPSVVQHTCTCEISSGSLPSGQDAVQVSLPSWATDLDRLPELDARRIEMRIPRHGDNDGAGGSEGMVVVHLLTQQADLQEQPVPATPVWAAAPAVESHPALGSPLQDLSPSVSTQTVTPSLKMRFPSSASQRRSRLAGPKDRLSPMCLLRKRKHDSDLVRSTVDKRHECEGVQVQAEVSAVDVRVVVDPFRVLGCARPAEPESYQYSEISMALVRPEQDGELVVGVGFDVEPEDAIEVIGVWIGACKVGRGKGLEVEQRKASESGSIHQVAVDVSVGMQGGSSTTMTTGELPLLKMVVKTTHRHYPTRASGSDSADSPGRHVLVLPSFASQAGVYRLTIDARLGCAVEVDETDLVVLASSGVQHGMQLAGYSVASSRTAVYVRERGRWRGGWKSAAVCGLVCVLVAVASRSEEGRAGVEWVGRQREEMAGQCMALGWAPVDVSDLGVGENVGAKSLEENGVPVGPVNVGSTGDVGSFDGQLDVGERVKFLEDEGRYEQEKDEQVPEPTDNQDRPPLSDHGHDQHQHQARNEGRKSGILWGLVEIVLQKVMGGVEVVYGPVGRWRRSGFRGM